MIGPRRYRAPGRVNLIGEHTDYNDGFVMPAAIAYDIHVATVDRSDHRVTVASSDFPGTREFDLRALRPGVEHDWSDHVRGVLIELQTGGTELRGARLHITSDLPIGAGLSSSAALGVAVGYAMLDGAGSPIDPRELARIAQRAENAHAGAQCGIMDPFISANARPDHALLLDTRDLAFAAIPLPRAATFVVCNTMVKHAHATGGYNARRAECELGVRILSERYPRVRALREVTLAQLESARAALPEAVFRRCRHVVTENERVLAAANALRAGDLRHFGD